SEEPAERSQVEVEVVVGEVERVLQLVHALLQRHQGPAEPFDLLVGEAARLDAPDRLALHQLAQQLDQREHELRQTARHVVTVGVDPHAGTSITKLYGGQGPVTTACMSRWGRASSSARARNS